MKKCWLRKTSGSPGSSLMLRSAAKVSLSLAEAWQLVQPERPKLMLSGGLSGLGGQSGDQPFQPYQPQNQPS